MEMGTHTNGAVKGTRERRFSKQFLSSTGNELDGADINAVYSLGIAIDGHTLSLSLEDLSEDTIKRLVLDGLYDRITRSVHAAKPKAMDAESAIKVMEDTFAQIKSGKFRKGRKGGIGTGPRTFDAIRFREAVVAGAKGNGVKVSDEKLDR